MRPFVVEVGGVPAPKGSKVRTRYGMRESSKRVKPWEELVVAAVMQQMDAEFLFAPLAPPYRVEVAFFFRKPRTSRARYPVAPTIGDLDKLERSVGDPLTQAGLIEDDRHIVKWVAEKAWAGPAETPGAVISVYSIEEDE
jgi:Holliday junction resolvase RusA-like endonuclease